MAYRNQILVFAVSFLTIGSFLLSLPQLTTPAYAVETGVCCLTRSLGAVCVPDELDCTRREIDGIVCGTCDFSVSRSCECSIPAPLPDQELVTNGNFETGNTSGWSVSIACVGIGPVGVFEAYTGTTAPVTFNTILAPPQGNYAAISDYNGTATASTALYQEIAVPANQSVSCSLIYYYNSFGEFISGQGLECDGDNNQTARIDIMKPGSGAFDTGEGVLENLYQTEPGDPLTLGYTTLNFDLSEYAGSTIGLRIATASNFQGVLQFMVDDVTCSVDQLPEPDVNGSVNSSGCSLLAGAKSINGPSALAGLLGYLLIPAFIVIRRKCWRR